MGKNMRRLLLKAIKHPGWNTYAWGERATANAISTLVSYGFIEVNEHRQFRLIGNEQLFQLQADVNDMNASRRTQFTRCKCGHLHDTDLHCLNCKVQHIRPRFAANGQREFGGSGC